MSLFTVYCARTKQSYRKHDTDTSHTVLDTSYTLALFIPTVSNRNPKGPKQDPK